MINDDDRYNDDHYDYLDDDPLWMRMGSKIFMSAVIILAVFLFIGAMILGIATHE